MSVSKTLHLGSSPSELAIKYFKRKENMTAPYILKTKLKNSEEVWREEYR